MSSAMLVSVLAEAVNVLQNVCGMVSRCELIPLCCLAPLPAHVGVEQHALGQYYAVSWRLVLAAM